MLTYLGILIAAVYPSYILRGLQVHFKGVHSVPLILYPFAVESDL